MVIAWSKRENHYQVIGSLDVLLIWTGWVYGTELMESVREWDCFLDYGNC